MPPKKLPPRFFLKDERLFDPRKILSVEKIFDRTHAIRIKYLIEWTPALSFPAKVSVYDYYFEYDHKADRDHYFKIIKSRISKNRYSPVRLE